LRAEIMGLPMRRERAIATIKITREKAKRAIAAKMRSHTDSTH